jgi:aminoglycoside phosphotransferase (APT) family kinase protein
MSCEPPPVADPGPLVGRGRAADVYDIGGGRVLRRYRTERDCTGEARVHAHLRAHGFPVPEVHEAGGRDMVMDRIEGIEQIDDLKRRPWRVAAHGRLLADLHRRLDDVPPLDGGAVVHGDLHPGNVLLSPDGPVVIDWSNAGPGDRAADVATTWMLLATGVPPGGRLELAAAAVLRRLLLRAFLGGVDVDAARQRLPEVCDRRLDDPNLLPEEVAAVRALRGSAPG